MPRMISLPGYNSTVSLAHLYKGQALIVTLATPESSTDSGIYPEPVGYPFVMMFEVIRMERKWR